MIRKYIHKILSIVLVISMLSPAAVFAAGESTAAVFFEEEPAQKGSFNNWSGCSWEVNKQAAKKGTNSLKVTFSPSNAWEGLVYTFDNPITVVNNPNNFAIGFWIKTQRGNTTSVTMQLNSRDSSGRVAAAAISLPQYINEKNAGKWTYVQIPLSKLSSGEYWNGSYNETIPANWNNMTGFGFKTDGTKLSGNYSILIDDWKLIENFNPDKNSSVLGNKEKNQRKVEVGDSIQLFDDYYDDCRIFSGKSSIEPESSDKKKGRAAVKITFDTGNYHGANLNFDEELKFEKAELSGFALHFWAKLPREIQLSVGLTENTEHGNVKSEVNLFDYISGSQLGEWTEVMIPLSKLPGSGMYWDNTTQSNVSVPIKWEHINSFSITINTNGQKNLYEFYLDDISIVKNTVVEYSAKTLGIEEADFDEQTKDQNFTKIDLKPYMNMAYRDEVYHDNQGGWIDQGNDDMRNFNLRGENKFLNVPFDIIQPEDNDGKSVLVMRGQNRMNFPNEVEIDINHAAKGIYFLHSAAWVESKVGEYIINYTDGTSIRVPLVRNMQVNDWGESFHTDEARTVIQIANENGKMGGFGVFAWANPKPEECIKSITVRTTGSGSFLMLEAVTLTDKGPYMLIPNSVPQTNPDTSKWYPYQPSDPEKMKGGVLDRSVLLDAPAGKHGKLYTEGEDFIFEDGTKAKFIGTNIVAQANFQSEEEIDRMLDEVAMAGYNLIRLHHLDASWSKPNIFGNKAVTTELDSMWMDRFDYLCAGAKKRGIYLYVDGLVHRQITKADVPDSPDSASAGQGAKIAGDFDPELIALQKDYLKQLFVHKNKYTGLSLSEDPALVMVDIHNEDSLLWRGGALGWLSSYHKKMLDSLFCKWLSEKYRTLDELSKAWREDGKTGLLKEENFDNLSVAVDYYDDEKNKFSRERKRDICRFLFDVQVNYYDEMADYMRNELGIGCMICGSNVPETEDTLDILANVTINADFLDRHRYYTHPSGSNYNYSQGLSLGDSMNLMISYDNDKNLVHYFGKRRVYGMPYVLSEWNSCEPNQYAAGDMMYMNAYSAMNNWTPINFAFLQGYRNKSNRLSFVFNSSESPVKMAMQRASAQLLLRGDVSEAEYGYYAPATKSQALDTEFEQEIPSGLPMIAKSGIMWADLEKTKPNPQNSYSQIKKLAEQADGVYVSATGELKTDTKSKLFEINTPKSQGFSGILEGRTVELENIDFRSDNHFAAVILTALDDEAIANSGHMLLTATARNRNTDQEFSNDGTLMKKGGTAPILMEPVLGTLKLKTGANYKIWILNSSGERVREANVQNGSDGCCELVMSEDDNTMYYELKKTEDIKTEKSANKPEWAIKRTFKRSDSFSDIDGHWAESAISLAKSEGILAEEKQVFLPNQAVSRAEFIAWMMRSANIMASGEGFADVPDNNVYYNEITSAKASGIVIGRENGKFEPDGVLTREEAAIIMIRILLWKNITDAKPEGNSGEFTDLNDISPSAVFYVYKAVNAKLLSGRDNKLCPRDTLTRAEAIVLARRLKSYTDGV